MKTGKLIIFIITLSFTTGLIAQDDEVLLSVAGREVSRDEFKWLYLKNNTADRHTGIEEYLDLYTRLRLKVRAAEDAGLHERTSFKDELAGYRKQLAKNYLTDHEVKDRMLQKAYERYKTEINASHILVKCPPEASPSDSLKAYNKALDIRLRIKLGEPFESVAKGASDDPSVNINGGRLGYFTVFQTPLPFENAVYRMERGDLSMPVRTKKGYHIISVRDKKNNPGRIKVAHIMKATPPGSTEAKRRKAKQEIDSLYTLLQQGADFSRLAGENSDDQMSAQNNGELPWFGSGEMIHEFSVAAFQLLRDGEITEPVKTAYGWHIIKRLDKELLPSREEAKKYLESRLSHSYLMEAARKSFAEKLKTEYDYKLSDQALKWFIELADSSFRNSGDFSITTPRPDDILYSFASEKCYMSDFAEYIKKEGGQAPVYDSLVFINSLLDKKVIQHLIDYEDSVLEDKYPEFGYLMNEFYDGILFFEISDSLIWKRTVNDSTGLAAYYETRKDEFMDKPAVKARIYKIDRDAGRRKTRRIRRSIRRNHDKENYYRAVMAEAASGKDTLAVIKEGTWEKGENMILEKIKWEKGLHHLDDDKNGTILVDILGIKEAQAKDLNDIKGSIIPGYQSYLEERWLMQLKNKYGVSVNRDELEQLKSEIEK